MTGIPVGILRSRPLAPLLLLALVTACTLEGRHDPGQGVLGAGREPAAPRRTHRRRPVGLRPEPAHQLVPGVVG